MAGNIETRVLIVDDEEVLRDMVARILRSMGIESEVAGDGLEALEKLKNGRFDMVIADIRMPNMDGIQLLKTARREFPGVDILIMTAHTSQYSFLDVVESGAVDYIMKPFSVEELKAKIGRVQRERKTINDLLQRTRKLEDAYKEILALKDEEAKIVREINYERNYLLEEIERLKADNEILNRRLRRSGES